MKKKYNKPEFLRCEIFLEHSIVTASLDTEESIILIDKEVENTSTDTWNIDLES